MRARQWFHLVAVTFVGGGITILPALLHGYISNRWRKPVALEAAAERMPIFPDEIFGWKSSGETTSFGPNVVRELHLANHQVRTYRHDLTNTSLTFALMVGPPGPLCRHPPEVCYDVRANERLSAPVEIDVTMPDGSRHQLRRITYRTAGRLGRELSLYYGYAAGGGWEAPRYPRLHYGYQPFVYKVQFLVEGISRHESGMASDVANFIREFIRLYQQEVGIPVPVAN